MRASKSQVLKMEESPPFLHKSLSTSLLPNDTSWPASLSDDEIQSGKASEPEDSNDMFGAKPPKNEELQSLPPRPPRRVPTPARVQHPRGSSQPDVNTIDEKPNIEMKTLIDAGDENSYCKKTPSTLNTPAMVKKTDPSSNLPYTNPAHAEVNVGLTTQPHSNLGGNLLSRQMDAKAESCSDLNSASFSPSQSPFVHLSAPSSTLCHLQQCVTSCHYDMPPHATQPCVRKSSAQNITRTVAISSPQLGPQETEMRCVELPSPRKSVSGQNKSLKPFRQRNLSSCSPRRSCASKGDPKSDHRNIKRWSAPSYALPWSLSSFASPKFASHSPGSQNTFQKNTTPKLGSPLQSQKYSQKMNSSKRSPNRKPVTVKSPKELPKSGPFGFHMSTRTSPQYGTGSEHFDNISPKVIDYESWTLGGTVSKFPSSSHSVAPQASAGAKFRQGAGASRKQTDGSQLNSIFESVQEKESNSRSEGRESDTLSEILYSDLNWTNASQGSFEYVSTNSRTSSDLTRRFSENSMASANGLTEIACIQDKMIADRDGQTNILAVAPEEKAETTHDALCLVEQKLKPKKSRKRPTAWNFEDRLANNGCPVGVCSPIIRMDDTEFVVAEDSSDRNSLSPSTTSSLVHDGQNYEVFVERNKIMVVIKTPPGQSLLTSGLSPLDPVIQDFARRGSPPIGAGPNNLASLSPALEYARCADVQLQTTVIQHERLVSGARPHLSRELRGPNTQSTALTASKNWSAPGHSAAIANGRQVKSGNVSRSPPKCLLPTPQKPFQRNSEGTNRKGAQLGSRFSRPSCGKEARGGEVKPPPKSRWQPTTRALAGERKQFALRAREKRETPNQNREVRPKLSSVVAMGVTKASSDGYTPSNNTSKNKFKRKKTKEPPSRPRVKQQEKPKVRSEMHVQKAKNDNQNEGAVKVRSVANKKRSLLTETKFPAPSSGNSVVGNTELNVGLKPKRCKRRKKRPIEKKKNVCDKTDIGGNRKNRSCKAESPIDSLGSGDIESWKSARSHYESEKQLVDSAAIQNVDRSQLQKERSLGLGQKKIIPNSSYQVPWAADSVPSLIQSSTRARLHNSQRGLSSIVCAEDETEVSQAPPLRSQKLSKDNTVGTTEAGIRAGGYGSKPLQKEAKRCMLKQQYRPPSSPRRDSERKPSLAPNQINSWKHNKPGHTSLCSLDLLERCMMTLQLDHKAGRKPSPRSSVDRRTVLKGTSIAKNPKAPSRFKPPSFKTKVAGDRGNQAQGRTLREKPLTLSRQTTLESIQSNNTLSTDCQSVAKCMRNSLGSKQPSLHKVRFQPNVKEETQHSFQSNQLRSSKAQKSGKTSTICSTIKISTFATQFKSLLLPNSPTACKMVERMVPECVGAAVDHYSDFSGDQSLKREAKAAQKSYCYEPDASPDVRVRDMTRHLVTRSKLGFQKSKINWPSALIFSYPSIWLAVIVNFILMYIYNIGIGHNKFA